MPKPGTASPCKARRDCADLQESTEEPPRALLRATIVAYIRSAAFAGKLTGIYVVSATGAPRATEQNLILIGPSGAPLEGAWAESAELLANASDAALPATIDRIFRQQSNCTGLREALLGNVVTGHSGQAGCPELTAAIEAELAHYRCTVTNYGHVPAPELHFIVCYSNLCGELVTRGAYVEHLKSICAQLHSSTKRAFPLCITGNVQCAASEVLRSAADQEIPENNGISKNQAKLCVTLDAANTCVSLHAAGGVRYSSESLCVFLAVQLQEQAARAGIAATVGAVLASCADSGAVEFLKSRMPVVQVRPDMASMLHAARGFDIAVLFDPAGRGAVCFSRAAASQAEQLPEACALRLLSRLFAIGTCDANAVVVAVSALLSDLSELQMYSPRLSRTLAVAVDDVSAIEVDTHGRLADPYIGAELDMMAQAFTGAVCVWHSAHAQEAYVRAEAQTTTDCDKLALLAAEFIYDRCGGVGIRPEISYHPKSPTA